jgi:hypothetical protein
MASTKDARNIVREVLASDKATGLEGALKKFIAKHDIKGDELENFVWILALVVKRGEPLGKQQGYYSGFHHAAKAIKKGLSNG